MKPNRWYTAVGLLVFFLLSLVPGGQAQIGAPVSYVSMPAQLALSWTFNSNSPATGGFTVAGLRYWQITFVPVGTVLTCAVSLDSSVGAGFSTGGVIPSSTIGSCATATTYSNSSSTTPTQIGQLTPTITGSGSVIVVLLGYINNPGAAGSASSTITSPLDGSGYVEVNCKTGCTGTTLGQTTMSSSLPVAIASNQSTVPVSTQPTGFGTLIGFQQAVTASAVALPSNSSHSFCLQSLPSNSITIYVGPSGITTSTGFALQPGQSACWQLSNTNLVYVIASTTGAGVAVTGS
jgi:hypothetical protein